MTNDNNTVYTKQGYTTVLFVFEVLHGFGEDGFEKFFFFCRVDLIF